MIGVTIEVKICRSRDEMMKSSATSRAKWKSFDEIDENAYRQMYNGRAGGNSILILAW
jgi:hypothetical protein